MRFVSTRAAIRTSVQNDDAVSFRTALFRGLAPDGGLYMPEIVEAWSANDLASLSKPSIVETAVRCLRPYVAEELASGALVAVVDDALRFPIPLVEIEPGTFALELFHGPTLAFKDIGARVMARLMAAFRGGGSAPIPLTILVATSGDTGAAVGDAFKGLGDTRVAILYPDGRVSAAQEAQLTSFNAMPASNVRAYAVSGTFDDCQRLVKGAFADRRLREEAGLTSANSINIGRLLPQMVYYFHAAGLLAARGISRIVFSTPSGNFGNLTAGVMAKRAGAPIARFVAATNVNDVVPEYLATGRFAARPSIATIANAMDCGDPSNFDRLQYLFDGRVEAMRSEIAGSSHTDEEVRGVIKWMFEERGYLLDPHSAIAYLGVDSDGRDGQDGQDGRVFLATAHPGKFADVVEPIIGRSIDPPQPLAVVLAAPREIRRIAATAEAVAAACRFSP